MHLLDRQDFQQIKKVTSRRGPPTGLLHKKRPRTSLKKSPPTGLLFRKRLSIFPLRSPPPGFHHRKDSKMSCPERRPSDFLHKHGFNRTSPLRTPPSGPLPTVKTINSTSQFHRSTTVSLFPRLNTISITIFSIRSSSSRRPPSGRLGVVNPQMVLHRVVLRNRRLNQFFY